MSEDLDEAEAPGELPSSLTIELAEAIKFKGAEYTCIELREPKTREVQLAESRLRSAVNPETIRQHDVALVAAVSGLPEPVVQALPIRKLNEAIAYLSGFLVAGRRTGGTS